MIIAQFGQLQENQPTEPLPAITACVQNPVACAANFSKIMADLASLSANRHVLELIGQGLNKGPQGGLNPFFIGSLTPDVIRAHAEVDPDFATDLLIQSTTALLHDVAAAQQNTTIDGFFVHAISGIEARFMIRVEPVPPLLRQRAIDLLQQLSASGMIEVANRAEALLSRMGFPKTSPIQTTDSLNNRLRTAGAFVLGAGAIVVGTLGLISAISSRTLDSSSPRMPTQFSPQRTRTI